MKPFFPLIAKILLRRTFCLVLPTMAKCTLQKRTMTFYTRSASWIKQAVIMDFLSVMHLHMTKSSCLLIMVRANFRIIPKSNLKLIVIKRKPNITITKAKYSKGISFIYATNRGTKTTVHFLHILIFTLTVLAIR